MRALRRVHMHLVSAEVIPIRCRKNSIDRIIKKRIYQIVVHPYREEFKNGYCRLSTLIKTRRSIRVFQDKPVSESLLMQAVDTAAWGSNGGNAELAFLYYPGQKRLSIQSKMLSGPV